MNQYPRTWRSVLVGGSCGLAARAMAMPFNERLRAYNVIECEADLGVIDEVLAFHREHVAPSIEKPDGAYRSGSYRLWAKRPPGWQTDLRWFFTNDEFTHAYFEDVFRRLRIPDQLGALIEHEREVRLYTAAILTRSVCDVTHFHYDFAAECGTRAYALVTPLADYAPAHIGQMVYHDVDGFERVYEYHRGRAVAFGGLFPHGTQPSPQHPVRAYLTFNFGTDKQQYWHGIRRTLDGNAPLVRLPDGRFELG